MTLAVSSALAFAGVVAYGSSREPTLAPVVATVGALGAVLLLVMLMRRSRLATAEAVQEAARWRVLAQSRSESHRRFMRDDLGGHRQADAA